MYVRMLFLNPRTVKLAWLVANVYFENQELLLWTSFVRERFQILKPLFNLKKNGLLSYLLTT